MSDAATSHTPPPPADNHAPANPPPYPKPAENLAIITNATSQELICSGNTAFAHSIQSNMCYAEDYLHRLGSRVPTGGRIFRDEHRPCTVDGRQSPKPRRVRAVKLTGDGRGKTGRGSRGVNTYQKSHHISHQPITRRERMLHRLNAYLELPTISDGEYGKSISGAPTRLEPVDGRPSFGFPQGRRLRPVTRVRTAVLRVETGTVLIPTNIVNMALLSDHQLQGSPQLWAFDPARPSAEEAAGLYEYRAVFHKSAGLQWPLAEPPSR
ncbi:hypothetical protein FB45DRAFT_1080658 [Roridomyces roridus]|uniref:Uncharacterized protein n=1 Tax=Roridomyces roridus TaxID=1738132 RepID=A0AAD7FMV4_9AGAR|nr:hypothetical protein FB45DRAFT_1080658 [Roridomyces roridus]